MNARGLLTDEALGCLPPDADVQYDYAGNLTVDLPTGERAPVAGVVALVQLMREARTAF